MVTINFTLVCEIVSFLVFLWVSNTFMFQPLRRLMEERESRIARDKEAARNATAEAERLSSEYVARLTEAHQNAAVALRQTRQDAYLHHRAAMDARRHDADAALTQFREELVQKLDEERKQYAGLLKDLVGSIDRQIRQEGTVR